MLANEQVVDGRCWRHEDTIVEQRDLEQWFFRITAYAQELLDGLDKLDGWPEKVRTMQRNWIGRSEGTEVDFAVENRHREDSCLHHARRHHLRRDQRAAGARAPARRRACRAADPALKTQVSELLDEQKKAREAGDVGAIEKHGVPTGHFAINPYNGERVPIWVANYILMDYGTGAIMSVPGHDERDFEFATKYGDCPFAASSQPADPQANEPELPFIVGGRRARQLRRVQRPHCAQAQKQLQEVCRAQGLWRSHGHLSPQGLGRQPPALLGHAHSHDSSASATASYRCPTISCP